MPLVRFYVVSCYGFTTLGPHEIIRDTTRCAASFSDFIWLHRTLFLDAALTGSELQVDRHTTGRRPPSPTRGWSGDHKHDPPNVGFWMILRCSGTNFGKHMDLLRLKSNNNRLPLPKSSGFSSFSLLEDARIRFGGHAPVSDTLICLTKGCTGHVACHCNVHGRRTAPAVEDWDHSIGMGMGLYTLVL